MFLRGFTKRQLVKRGGMQAGDHVTEENMFAIWDLDSMKALDLNSKGGSLLIKISGIHQS